MFRGLSAACGKLANWDRSGLGSRLPSSLCRNEPPVSKSSKSTAKNGGHIYIGVGGWTFEPWRGVFYPEKLTQAKELSYAASKLTSIEINGTYYGSQKPESFRKWASDCLLYTSPSPRDS